MLSLRSAFVLSYDACAALAAFCMGLLLRYDFQLPASHVHLLAFSGVYLAVCLVVFAGFRLHRSVWRYTTSRDMWWLVQAVSLSVVITVIALFFLTRLEDFPRTAFAITWLLHMAFSGAPRFALRMWRERQGHAAMRTSDKLQNVLVVGMNDAADLFIREALRQSPRQFKIHGILSDQDDAKNRMIQGIPVLGSPLMAGRHLEQLAAKGVHIDVLVLTNRSHAHLDTIFEVAKAHKVTIKRLPNVANLEEGERATSLKPVLIEDLLGRAPIQLDMKPVDALVSGKTVLVTGAGGSIGSELCRQIAARAPQALLMLDHGELALYSIDMEMARNFPQLTRIPVLADVTDAKEISRVLAEHKVDIIFHAAAYKHVPMVEANPIAGIENNLFGTFTVAKAAQEANVKKLVVISTDKAVNPTNVMGATKRAAEIVCQNMNGDGHSTAISAVRFGNVLGSTGSVVPLFTRQIKEGGPVTVTHKNATRYFMTIPEAVQLVLQAGAMGQGGEVFMLDMGEPVKIWHLAEEMVRLSGLNPHEDIEIKEVGLRPGEKLFEEMWYDGEAMSRTKLKQVFLVAPKKLAARDLKKLVQQIEKACIKRENADAVQALAALVEEYAPAANSPYFKDSDKD